jgi:ParB family chromosome partitioning protein
MSDIYRDSIFWVEIERIKPNPYQPRREFDQDKLAGLAESIRMYGLLQPLTVTRNELQKEDGGIAVEYELIAGERRLRASKLAGLHQVPVIIRSGQDTDEMKLELAIIENLQREDLNPVDRAKAFHRLHKEFSFTHVDIGKKVGKSREYVSNTLRLLLLPEFILSYLAEGRMSEGHTRPLLMLNDKPEEQTVLAKEILLKKLTVRESETLARRAAQDKVSSKHKINPEILDLERKLTEKLGTRVQIEQREVGGKLVISFFSAEDLSTLLNTMQLEKEGNAIAPIFNGNANAPTENLADKVAENTDVFEEEVFSNNNAQGMTPSELGFEKGTEDISSEEPTVVPEASRPLPETEAVPSSTILSDVFVPRPAPLVEEVKEPEEDPELYSIRNFSI